MAVIDLTNDNFDTEIEAHPLMVVDFWAPWCAPCRAFAPIFEAAAAKHPDMTFARINTEAEPTLAKQFEVQSIPMLLGVKDGTIVKIQLGALPPDRFEAMLTEIKNA